MIYRTAFLYFVFATNWCIAAEPIQVTHGPVVGVETREPSVEVFKGIPYAAPPVGDLRWRPPQPPEPWDAVKVCDTFGAASLQTRNRKGMPQSEDCLYLNVWRPRSSKEKLPVMVWIQ